MAQFIKRSNQAQGMLLSCVASQKMEISVLVFIPEVNISHMVEAQQQSSIENLVGSVHSKGVPCNRLATHIICLDSK